MKNEEKVIILIREAISKAILEIESKYKISILEDKHLLKEVSDPISAASGQATMFFMASAAVSVLNSGIPTGGTGTALLKRFLYLSEGMLLFKVANEYEIIANTEVVGDAGAVFYGLMANIFYIFAGVLITISVLPGLTGPFKYITNFPYLSTVFGIFDSIRGASSKNAAKVAVSKTASVIAISKRMDAIEALLKRLNEVLSKNSFYRLNTNFGPNDSLATKISSFERFKTLNEPKPDGTDALITQIDELIENTSEDARFIIEMTDQEFADISRIFQSSTDPGVLDEILNARFLNMGEEAGSANINAEKLKIELREATEGVISDNDFDQFFAYFMEEGAARQMKEAINSRKKLAAAKTKEASGFFAEGKKTLNTIREIVNGAFSKRNPKAPLKYAKDLERVGLSRQNIDVFMNLFFDKITAAIKGTKIVLKIGESVPVEYEIVEYCVGGFLRLRLTEKGFNTMKNNINKGFNEINLQYEAMKANQGGKFSMQVDSNSSGLPSNIDAAYFDNETVFGGAGGFNSMTNVSGTNNLTMLGSFEKIREGIQKLSKVRSKKATELKRSSYVKYDEDSGIYSINDEALERLRKGGQGKTPDENTGGSVDTYTATRQNLEADIADVNTLGTEINKLEALNLAMMQRGEAVIPEFAIPAIYKDVNDVLEATLKSNKNNATNETSVKGFITWRANMTNLLYSKSEIGTNSLKTAFKFMWNHRYKATYAFEFIFKSITVTGSKPFLGIPFGHPEDWVSDALGNIESNAEITSVEGRNVKIEGVEMAKINETGHVLPIFEQGPTGYYDTDEYKQLKALGMID